MEKIRTLTISIGLLLSLVQLPLAARERREPRKMGTSMEADSLGDYSRHLEQRLFIGKGEVALGASFSYLDLSSSDSQFFMLLQDFNAYGKTFSVTPMVSYAIADNKAVGVQIKYSNADAVVSGADLSLLSDDLSLSLSDLQAHNNSIETAFFYRSCIGLDDKGRFGLFTDLELAYSHGKSLFSYAGNSLDSYTISDKVNFSIHPGLEVFVMNNVSVQVSIGIGGASYTSTRCIKAGEVVGRRDASTARFYLDITDIALGITFHI